MHLSQDFFMITGFPDFHERGFDINEYNNIFKTKNVIIHASSKKVSYAEHWGPLSVKCIIKGTEHYKCSNRFYSVDKNHYLIFNEGQYYSSYIHSDIETESFTVNFSNAFLQQALQSLNKEFEDLSHNRNCEFIEKLYTIDPGISSLLLRLYSTSIKNEPDIHIITETYHLLLENLLLKQLSLRNEIRKVNAVKFSTQLELYKRLNYAKDYIHSCYMNEIDLELLSTIACLNSTYFLREFKKYFGVTPYQYIISQRLDAAKRMLQHTSQSITDICYAVGYSDISSFTKLFKKRFHFTPEKFRKTENKKSVFTC